jgi:DNA-binding transcriptional MerR regulator
MKAMATEDMRYVGISEVSEWTGLSPDTLRWYEREGLLPRVERDSGRRRRYSPRDVRLLRALVRLRRTGMPTKEMREFIRLVTEGTATHGQRLALLAAHRERVAVRLVELQDDLAELDEKVEHYRLLIEQGLECAGDSVDPCPRSVNAPRAAREVSTDRGVSTPPPDTPTDLCHTRQQ